MVNEGMETSASGEKDEVIFFSGRFMSRSSEETKRDRKASFLPTRPFIIFQKEENEECTPVLKKNVDSKIDFGLLDNLQPSLLDQFRGLW
jgi:hypothetical protein